MKWRHIDTNKPNKTILRLRRGKGARITTSMGGVVIIEFVGLRAKMYSILAANTCKKTAKGISTIVKEKEIRHEDYKTTLFKEKQMMHK